MLLAFLIIYALFNSLCVAALWRRHTALMDKHRFIQSRVELLEKRSRNDCDDCRGAISDLDCEFAAFKEKLADLETTFDRLEIEQHERQEAADKAAQAFTDGVASILGYDTSVAMKREAGR